ncbi:hypothetical protein ABZ249_31495 [Nocardiopsis sp. NPDC006139]|uniref:hypothetical protein n=1 Tax=Nocardiopsis sp. NPDC006139 TaxID=3154578 RepID=UPI0033A92841
MRTTYSTPTATFYRCEQTASRRWREAHRTLMGVRRDAVSAFTARHRALLGEGGYLWDSIVHGWVIVAPARPAGCRPHPHAVRPTDGLAWLPDRRTRTGRMLHDQITGLPAFDYQAVLDNAPYPGAMPFIHDDGVGRMAPYRAVVDDVVHLCWPAPVPGLDPAVWEEITRAEYEAAVAEEAHQERVRNLGCAVAALDWVRETAGVPDLVAAVQEAATAAVRARTGDHPGIDLVGEALLRARDALGEYRHGVTPAQVALPRVEAEVKALHALAA